MVLLEITYINPVNVYIFQKEKVFCIGPVTESIL